MAHIVEFRTGAARGVAQPEPGPERGAEIIIFPGVRRERHAEPPAKPRRRAKGHPERDILELLEPPD